MGISKEWYQSTEEIPLNGPGQGNRVGPPMWMCISTVAMNILAALHQEVEFTDPNRKRKTSRPIDGFVDETTGCTNQFTMEILMFTNERHNTQNSYELLIAKVNDAQKMTQ